jgi:hypothetical protein
VIKRHSRRGFFGIVAAAAVGSVLPLPQLKPPTPPAISIPFDRLPCNIYIRGPRYRVYLGDARKCYAAAIAADRVKPFRLIRPRRSRG